MKFVKKDFLEVLQKCLPGIDNDNTILQGTNTFVFEQGKVYTYNDKISISMELNEDMKVIKGVVKANEFYKLLTKLPEDKELFLEVEENKWSIKGENLNIELSLLENNIKEYVEVIEGINKDWKDIPNDFFDALRCCKLNNNRTSFGGIAVKDNNMMACNGLILSWFEMEKEMGLFWIDNLVVDDLLKFDNLKQWCDNEKWLFFYDEGLCFACRKLNKDNFPFDGIINVVKSHSEEQNKIKGELPSILKSVVDRASVLSTDLDGEEVVKIILSKEGIECNTKRRTGNYQERINWEKEIEGEIKEPIEVWMDNNMVSYGLEKTNSFYIVETEMEDTTITRIIFYGDKFKRLVSTYCEE